MTSGEIPPAVPPEVTPPRASPDAVNFLGTLGMYNSIHKENTVMSLSDNF